MSNTFDSVPALPAAPHTEAPLPYINRELSWLDFNQRVLEEAWDERHPLLERVKFLAIFHANLDEFFMIRVSGLQVQRAANVSERAIDGLTPTEALQKIAVRVDELMHDAHHCARILLSALQREQIEIRSFADVSDADREYLHHYFESEIFPILTPLAVDSGHPFPHISNLSLNLAVLVRDPLVGDRFARMKIPGSLPRLVACPPDTEGVKRFTYIDEVIAHNVGALFPGLDAVAAYPFRITRNADIEIQEDEAEDLLRTVLEGVRERHFGFITRLEVTPRHAKCHANPLSGRLGNGWAKCGCV